MRSTQQLVPGSAFAAALLVAAGCIALVVAAPPKLEEVCSKNEGNVSCRCSEKYPDIDVVVSDTAYLTGSLVITIENCSLVKLSAHALEQTLGLQKLSVLNVSQLVLESPLPRSLRELVLVGIGKLAASHRVVFQLVERIERLIIRDVGFEELESHFLSGVSLNFTEITGCKFPNLETSAFFVKSQYVVMKGNTFANLSAEALTVSSENATVSDNSFRALYNGSIRRGEWAKGQKSKLSFERNTIEWLENGALSGLRASASDATISDNVLLCFGADYKSCKGSLGAAEGLRVCDAENVCPYRRRAPLIKALSDMRGCLEAVPLSTEECAVIAVGKKPSGVGAPQAPSSVAVVVALLATSWFTS